MQRRTHLRGAASAPVSGDFEKPPPKLTGREHTQACTRLDAFTPGVHPQPPALTCSDPHPILSTLIPDPTPQTSRAPSREGKRQYPRCVAPAARTTLETSPHTGLWLILSALGHSNTRTDHGVLILLPLVTAYCLLGRLFTCCHFRLMACGSQHWLFRGAGPGCSLVLDHKGRTRS